MCRSKRAFFHHRRHDHGGCGKMKRHGGKFRHEKHFEGPPRRCNREGSPNNEHHEKNYCTFGKKNRQIPHHDFGAKICERSTSPRHFKHHEYHRFRLRHHRSSHHYHQHQMHGHGRRFFYRRFSAEF